MAARNPTITCFKFNVETAPEHLLELHELSLQVVAVEVLLDEQVRVGYARTRSDQCPCLQGKAEGPVATSNPGALTTSTTWCFW